MKTIEQYADEYIDRGRAHIEASVGKIHGLDKVILLNLRHAYLEGAKCCMNRIAAISIARNFISPEQVKDELRQWTQGLKDYETKLTIMEQALAENLVEAAKKLAETGGEKGETKEG